MGIFLGRKAMTNLDSILKCRNITLPTKVHLSQSYGFFSSHIWMWESDYKESWMLKNWWFWIVLEKTLESPFVCRRSNQSILREISPEYSLEGLMLKMNTLATWCKELTHRKRSWCWWRFKVGGKEGDRGWDGWMASQTQWTWVWVNSGSWWCTGRPGVLQSKGPQRVGHDWVTELNWTELLYIM